MHRTLRIVLAAAAAAALAGFGSCGGSTPPPGPPGFFTLHVRGAVNEDLMCMAAAADYSGFDAGASTWMLDIPCYRSVMPAIDMVAALSLVLSHAPTLGAPYGFSATGATDPSIEGEQAMRYDSITAGGAVGPMTHEANYVPWDTPVGELGFTFTAIPGPGDPPYALHGTVAGTLPATAAGGYAAPVTVAGTF